MRRGRCAWILVAAALVAGIAAPAAQAITGVYSLQSSVLSAGGSLAQYSVGPGGALAPSGPDTTLAEAPRDITVTPDGRFAYVLTSLTATSTIVRLARVAANGRLEPATPSSTTNSGAARAIIVNPQGTRVLYAQPGGAIFWRAIAADGTLGASNPIAIPTTTPPPDVRSLAMTADGRNLYAADFPGTVSVRIWQFTVDPATGAATPKSPAVVGWPVAGGPTVGAGRMAIAPSGSHLYLATDTAGAGIGRWAIDPGTGALTGGAVDAPAADGYAEAAVALSTSGNALWAPSGSSAAAPERIRQFGVGAGGVAGAARAAGRQLRRRRPGARPRRQPRRAVALPRPGRHRRRVVGGARRHADVPRELARRPGRRARQRGDHAAAVAGAGRLVRRDAQLPPARRRPSTRARPPIPTGRSRATTGTSATARARRTPGRRRATSTPAPARGP